MIWALASSMAVNMLIGLYLFYYIRKTNELIKNRDILESWMEVYNSLHKANGVICMMKKIDADSIYFREPGR